MATKRGVAAVVAVWLDLPEAIKPGILAIVEAALPGVGRTIRWGWQDNRISVAQEHLATAMVNSLLAREFAAEKPEPPNDRSVVLAGVEGNQHAVGLRIVADALELAGWDVRYLGADTPTRSLVQLVRDERPNLVGLSASMPHHLRSAREAIACLPAENALYSAKDSGRNRVVVA